MFDSYKTTTSHVTTTGAHHLSRYERPALSFEQVMEDRLIEFVSEYLAAMALLLNQQRSLNLTIDRLLRTPGYHK